MRQLWIVLGIMVVAVLTMQNGLGHTVAYRILYGSIAISSALISYTFATFAVRVDDHGLARAMAIGWAGCSGLTGWWWVYSLLDRPEPMQNSAILLMICCIYLLATVLHFQSIGEAQQRRKRWTVIAIMGPVIAVIIEIARYMT